MGSCHHDQTFSMTRHILIWGAPCLSCQEKVGEILASARTTLEKGKAKVSADEWPKSFQYTPSLQKNLLPTETWHIP